MEHVPRPLVLEYEIPKYDGDLGRPNVFVRLDRGTRATARSDDAGRALREPDATSTGSRRRRSSALMRLRGVECELPERLYAEAFHCRKLDAGMTAAPAAEASFAQDLDTILAACADEFRAARRQAAADHRRRGFLGYYLVQAALRWNERRARRRAASSVTVFDNYARGVPAWLEALAGDPDLALVEPRHPRAAAGRHAADFDYIVHAAGIASPTYYRQHPHRDDGRERQRPAHAARLRARAARAAAEPVEGFLFFSSSEIYGDPTPDAIPTPETYRGNVSCTGPRACYDESKRYGETLCVNFARQHGAARSRSPARSTTTGPGLKITDRRVIPDFARDILAGRDIVHALRRTRHAHVLLRRGRRRRLLQGARRAAGPARRTTSASRSRRSRWRELAERIVEHRRGSCFGYEGAVVRAAERGRGLPRRQPEPPLPGDRRRRGPSSATSRRSTLDEGLRALAASGTATTARRRRPDEGLRSSARATSGSSPAPASRTAATTSSASTSTRSEVDAINAGRAPIHEAGLEELLARNVGARLRATTDLARPSPARDADADRGRHAVRRRRGSTSPRAGGRPRDRRGARAAGRTTTSSSSRARSCRARPTTSCAPLLEEALGQGAGRRLRRWR